jgi:hypothetical protein
MRLPLDRFLGIASAGTVGEDRNAASLPLSRVFLTEAPRPLDFNREEADAGFPSVLSASVTSPMSESMVPFP